MTGRRELVGLVEVDRLTQPWELRSTHDLFHTLKKLGVHRAGRLKVDSGHFASGLDLDGNAHSRAELVVAFQHPIGALRELLAHSAHDRLGALTNVGPAKLDALNRIARAATNANVIEAALAAWRRASQHARSLRRLFQRSIGSNGHDGGFG